MTQQAVQKDLETRMQAAIDALTREFAAVRTGRANAALLDGVRVEAYGNPTPINRMPRRAPSSDNRNRTPEVIDP